MHLSFGKNINGFDLRTAFLKLFNSENLVLLQFGESYFGVNLELNFLYHQVRFAVLRQYSDSTFETIQIS